MRLKTLAFASAAVLAVILIGILISRSPSQSSPLVGRDTPLAELSGNVSVATSPSDQAMSQRIAEAVKLAGIAELSPLDAQAIAGRAASTFHVLQQGDWNDYRKQILEQDLEVSPRLEEIFQSDLSLSEWARVIRDGELVPIAIEVRPLVLQGKDATLPPLPPKDSSTGVFSLKFTPMGDRGPNDVVDPVRAKTDAVEVVFPGELASKDGRFQGAFGIMLARRPNDGTWIVIGYSVRGPSGSGRISLPPI